MDLLLEQEGDDDREIEIEEKTCDEFDLKYRTDLFQISFVTNGSLSETAENRSKKVRASSSETTFVKLPDNKYKKF